MVKYNFTKGQSVWLYLTSSAPEYRKSMTAEDHIEEWIVTSVGRKCITAKSPSGWKAKFAIEDNFRHDSEYGTFYILHVSQELTEICGAA